MLPVIKDLYNGNVGLAEQNDLNVLLNQEPKASWIKKHPIATKVKYIPIERVEWLLTSIFIKWHTEIKQVQLLANSVVVTVKLHYKNPITGDMEYQDGVGGAPLQTDQGAGATDWTHIKSDAVMKAVPAAESFAVKDAAEKIGKLFGKDLNRADKIMYDSLADKFVPAIDYQAMINNAQTRRELADIFDKIPEAQKGDYLKALDKRKAELKK
jgi:hypothetical protein